MMLRAFGIQSTDEIISLFDGKEVEKDLVDDDVQMCIRDRDELTARFEALVRDCGGEAGDFLRKVFTGELWSRFRDWPAAVSHHHAYANGLLEHTLSVAECAKSMAGSMLGAGYDLSLIHI